MTRGRAALWWFAGLVAGAAASLGVGTAYDRLVDFHRADLIVPFLVVATAGVALALRPAARPAGVGVVTGAAVQSLLFLFLMDQLGTP